MPAYTKRIGTPACQVCGLPARVEVYNTRNALVGYYCNTHGRKMVADLDAREARRPAAR